MDKKVLKKTLVEQFVPYDEAVQDKLDYLMSDNVFANPGNIEEKEDLSLEDAFGDNVPISSRGNQKSVQNYDDDDYEDEEEDDEYDDRPKKPMTLAEKIAALRGVSVMPGDYLKRNN